jgi:predicted dehydrogenase
MQKTGVAIIGCGNISGPYAKDLASYPEINLVGASDLIQSRAEALAAKYGCKAYSSNEALLADEAVSIVVNLTIHHAHYEVTKQCLEAGKHVHSEKPLALRTEEARDLVAIAKAKGLRLGSSPFTWMGEAQQTAWKLIRDRKLGEVRLIYAEVNHGRIESWHPNPGPFYDVGPWFDVGVYPLTLITTYFGPARKVTATGKVLFPDRVTKEGVKFHIDTPDCVLATLELGGGQLVRLSVNFYVRDTRQSGIEFHGDAGSLHLGSWAGFNAPVAFAEFGKGLVDVTIPADAYKGTEWGRAIRDLVAAIREDRPHRATGAQAAHVVEILNAAVQSMKDGRPVEIQSSFPQPEPMDWAK